jgi:hypothetical protein
MSLTDQISIYSTLNDLYNRELSLENAKIIAKYIDSVINNNDNDPEYMKEYHSQPSKISMIHYIGWSEQTGDIDKSSIIKAYNIGITQIMTFINEYNDYIQFGSKRYSSEYFLHYRMKIMNK